MIPVGIDDLNVYGSSLTVQAADLARARGNAPAAAAGIGLLRRSLPPAFEDPVTLAANAARPLDLAGVGLCVVATESGVDFAKPVSSYLQRWLGLSERCRHVEMKHACYAGTAALGLAAAWVRERPERRALVVMTDMARRLFGDPAEPAEGAGAVAIIVSARPRVLALDPWSGVAAREIYDVMRPTPTLETIHAALSLAAYLDLLEVAWAGYAEEAGPGAFARLERFAFHTPVAPLVRQAHGLLVETHEPDVSTEELAARFERQVAPSLTYTRELGNTYSACLYAALAGLVDSGFVGRTGLYSYGSGSCAELTSGVIGELAAETVGRHGIAARLAARRTVDVPTYERLVAEHEAGLVKAEHVPDRDLVPGLYDEAYRGRGLLVLESVRAHYRAYAWS
jgi:3-hydroxy-3-methylglutaryl CoA synthase